MTELKELLGQRPEGDYDPPPKDRVYFTSVKNGEKGWLVRRAGALAMKLDRPGEDKWVKYQKHEWVELHEYRPLTRLQIARVAFEADRALCKSLNLFGAAKKEWINMREEDRIRFMDDGPKGMPSIRKRLWGDIMGRLKPLT